jgi:hypothetical protein
VQAATAAHRAADWDCQEAAAQRASAVPQAAPRRAAREVRAARLDLAALAPAEDQEAASAGLVLGLPLRDTVPPRTWLRRSMRKVEHVSNGGPSR